VDPLGWANAAAGPDIPAVPARPRPRGYAFGAVEPASFDNASLPREPSGHSHGRTCAGRL